jgi:site-specific DNA-methyltransferase (adenine-specific)
MTTGLRKTSSAESKRKCVKTTNYGFHKLMSYDSDMRFPTSVIRMAKDIQHSAIHPTQKPVALIEWLVRTYTNPGEIVMDNCSGSGSLAIACIKTGRNYICFEKDPDYYRLSIERIERYNVSSESEK